MNMEKMPRREERPADMVRDLTIEKTGKIDVINKDRTIKLKDCILALMTREFQLREEEISPLEKLEVLEESREYAFKVYQLFYEQIQRVFAYKGHTSIDVIQSIESFAMMINRLKVKYENRETPYHEYIIHLLDGIINIVLGTGILICAKEVQPLKNEPLLYMYLGAISKDAGLNPYLPQEFFIVQQKIQHILGKERFQEILSEVYFNKQDNDIQMGTLGAIRMNNLLKGGLSGYVEVTKDVQDMRKLVSYYNKSAATSHLIQHAETISEEYALMRKEFIKEWRDILENYSLEILPEFAFKLQGKLSHLGYIEIMQEPQDEKFGSFINTTIQENLIVAITDRLFLEKKIDVIKESNGTLRSNWDMPGLVQIFTLSKGNGMLRLGGSVIWHANAIQAYPMDLAQELSLFPGGEDFAIELQIQTLHEIKKQLVYQTSLLSNEEEVENRESEEEDIETEISEILDNEESDQKNTYENRLIKFENKCYETFLLPEGHVPTGKIQPILDELRKEISLPQNVSLRPLHPLSKHIGWKKVSEIIKKYFNCTVKQETGSSHFRVERVVDGKKFHAPLLSPKRNKYSKHAAFGTITSMLRKLHIDEEIFWNVIQGRFSPDQLINLNKEEYYERLNAISNKLM